MALVKHWEKQRFIDVVYSRRYRPNVNMDFPKDETELESGP